MAVSVKPVEQLELRGINTAGNPIQRPRGTAEICQNFRVMPGNWLRLRSGRVGRYNTTGTVRQIGPFRMGDSPGSEFQLAQVVFDGTTAKWHWFSLFTYLFAPAGFPFVTEIESISTTYDSGFALTKPAAYCNLEDRPIMYNGLGVRDGTNSKPPFSHYKSGIIRYFGLDAYCPSANPVAAFASGAGENQVITSVDIYVGLYSTATEHYSNGVLAGTIEGTSGTGTITVSSLGNLKYATHGSSETSDLYYVFYATIDGGEVPYLILNSALDGPHKVAVTEGSASLSIAAGTVNGWDLDLTKEMPTENFPPRPMRSVAYVNGRLYGAPMEGGSGTGGTFSYIPSTRELSAICWSAAAGDAVDTDLLGDPLQCWPLKNLLYMPSGDQPVVVYPALDGERVLVITPTSTILVEELADGVHIPIMISRIHGITNAAMLKETPYGLCWVTQRNQIVLMKGWSIDSLPTIEVISRDYQSVITGTPQCADYVLDPLNEVDRYQAWFSGSLCVCHDFGIGGQGYTFTGQDYTAAASAVNSDGKTHHIVAKTAVYTHEGQPEDGLIKTTDETFTTGQEKTSSEITGVYRRNWDDFGDSDVRKELPSLDITGDAETSALLARSPLVVEWWGDFEEASEANRKTSTGARIEQTSTADTFRYKFAGAKKFWFKFRLTLTGHSSDDASFATYPNPATEGNLAKNFYGSILGILWKIGIGVNRA